jgi:hypothetical protein
MLEAVGGIVGPHYKTIIAPGAVRNNNLGLKTLGNSPKTT